LINLLVIVLLICSVTLVALCGVYLGMSIKEKIENQEYEAMERQMETEKPKKVKYSLRRKKQQQQDNYEHVANEKYNEFLS